MPCGEQRQFNGQLKNDYSIEVFVYRKTLFIFVCPKKRTKRKGTRVTRPFGHLARPEIYREFENSVQTPSPSDFMVLSYVPMGIEQQPLLGASNAGPLDSDIYFGHVPISILNVS